MFANIKKHNKLCYLTKVVLLALTYYITGRLGLLLAVPPGYATAMWPPSGFALAGIILLGYEYWPGILLGSLCVNLFTSFNPDNTGTMLISASIAGIIAAGATLQAAFSAWLCRRWLTFPNILENIRDIGLLLLLGGPVGCLANSLLGVTTLTSFGLIPLEKAPFNWLTWWIGDSIGVLVFTPILLLITDTSAQVSLRRKKTVCITLLITFTATVSIFIAARDWEYERQYLAFERKASATATQLEDHIWSYRDDIYNTMMLFQASSQVERDEFKTFVQGVMARHPGIKGISWAKKIKASERKVFEAQQRKEGFPNFTIKQADATPNHAIPADERDIYYPVTYIEPYIELLHGFDNNSEATRRQTLEKARDQGDRQATPRLNILQKDKDNYGLLIYRPVYKKGLPHATLEERRNNIEGFIVGAFILADLIHNSLKNIEDGDIDLYITDDESPPDTRLLYDSRTPDHKENPASYTIHPQDMYWHKQIDMAGRNWSIHCIQNQASRVAHQDWTVWLVLAGGLLFTGLLGIFVIVITASTDMVRRVVEERTRQLRENEKNLSGVVALQRDVAHAHHNLEFAMNLIVERTQDLTSAEGAVIEMLEGHEMVYRATSGTANAHLGLRLAVEGSLSGLCVRSALTLHCNDAETDERVDKEACRKVGVASMVVVPLVHEGHAVGVLKVLSSKPFAFADQHVAMLELMAGVLSAALSDALINDNLRQSEETFRSAIEYASIGMALVDTDGRWLQVNQALCNLIGYSKEELLNIDFQTITHPDDLQQDLHFVNKMLAGEIDHYQMEKRYFHSKGHIIWVLLSVSIVLKTNGQPNYFIAQIQDITERKEMERLKTEFISVVSHELRTPLTSIRGSLGLILGALSKDLPEKVIHLLDIAHKNCERLILLINDILDIEKIESGKMRMEMKEENLADITKQAVDANEAYAQKFGVSIDTLPIDANIRIEVDAGRYVQVLSNLLSNAAKFSPKGEKITVAALNDGRRVRICVIDRGAGIAEEFRTRIFGKFAQADSSITRSKGGTGLGLNITKQITEQMGGTIGFDSEVGKGSTFWIEFPIIIEPLFQHKNVCVLPNLRRVLVCEDEEVYAQYIAAVLEKSGFAADIAHNIPEARRKLAESEYVALTLDIQLPFGSGLDLLKKLRLQAKTCHLPIIVVSANADTMQKSVDSKALDIAAWLMKPVQEQPLIDAVHLAIAQSITTIPHILHIEDDEDFSRVLAVALEGRAELTNAPTIKVAKSYLRMQLFDLIVLDLGMPEGGGAALLAELKSLIATQIPIVILSAHEPAEEIYAKATVVMVKSRTPETVIVDTILKLIPPYNIAKGK